MKDADQLHPLSFYNKHSNRPKLDDLSSSLTKEQFNKKNKFISEQEDPSNDTHEVHERHKLELNEFLEQAMGDSVDKVLTEPTVIIKEPDDHFDGLIKENELAGNSLLPKDIPLSTDIHSSNTKQRMKDKTIKQWLRGISPSSDPKKVAHLFHELNQKVKNQKKTKFSQRAQLELQI